MRAIVYKGDFIRKEGVAAAAITPGHLIELSSAGIVRVHANAGLDAARMFALENDLVGDDLDDAYGADDTVQYGVFESGAEVNAILAASQTIAVGDFLTSNGDGTLKLHDPTIDTSSSSVDVAVEAILAKAVVAVTTTGAVARIRAEVI